MYPYDGSGGFGNGQMNATGFGGATPSSGFGGFNGQSQTNSSAASGTGNSAFGNFGNFNNPFSAGNSGQQMPWWSMYQARQQVMTPPQQGYNTGIVPQSQGGSQVPPPWLQGGSQGMPPWLQGWGAQGQGQGMPPWMQGGQQMPWDQAMSDVRSRWDQAMQNVPSWLRDRFSFPFDQQSPTNAEPYPRPATQAPNGNPMAYNPMIQQADDPSVRQDKISRFINQNGVWSDGHVAPYDAVPNYSTRDGANYNPNQPVYQGIVSVDQSNPDYDKVYRAYNPRTMSQTWGLLENRYSPDMMTKVPKDVVNTYLTGNTAHPELSQTSGLGALLNLPQPKTGSLV